MERNPCDVRKSVSYGFGRGSGGDPGDIFVQKRRGRLSALTGKNLTVSAELEKLTFTNWRTGAIIYPNMQFTQWSIF